MIFEGPFALAGLGAIATIPHLARAARNMQLSKTIQKNWIKSDC